MGGVITRCAGSPNKVAGVMISTGAVLASSREITRARLLSAAKRRAASRSLSGGSWCTKVKLLVSDSLVLGKYGAPSGIILFLLMLFETGLCYSLIFAAQYHLLEDNIARNRVRNSCRQGNAGSAFICGYEGLDILSSPPPVSGLGMLAYGACEEYAATPASGNASGVDQLHVDKFGAFVRVPGSAFCATSNMSEIWTMIYWYADLLLLLLFCARVGQLEGIVEDTVDKFAWTTADYSVMFDGLRRGISCDELELSLRDDLHALGFSAETIHHVEFGVVGTSQTTTGHAFVAFNLEVDRNRLYELFHRAAQRGASSVASAPALAACMPRASAEITGKGVKVCLAPEPSNIRWGSLEILAEERTLRQRHSLRVSIWLLLASTVALVLIQWAKRSFTTEYAVGNPNVWEQLANPSVLIFIAASLAIAVTACKVRGTLTATHASEGHETQASYEAGLMCKLSAAFVSNNVVMPIAVTAVQSLVSSGSVVNQSWYERTGFVIFAVVLITIQRLTADLPRAMQLISLFRRHVASLCAPAEKLAELWEPPDLRVAVQFAQLYWLHACALLYGPLSPLFYALAAGYSLFSFACTKVGVVCWYKRPPAINAHLGAAFRKMILWLLPLHLVIKLFVRLAAESDDSAPLILAFFFGGLAIYAYAITTIVPGCATDDAGEAYSYQRVGGLDTESVRFADVADTKGYPIDVYLNPCRQSANDSSHKPQHRTGYFGEPPPSKGTVSEGIDQNSAALSSSLPLDDAPFV